MLTRHGHEPSKGPVSRRKGSTYAVVNLSTRLAHISQLLSELRRTKDRRRQRKLAEEVAREIDSAREALKPYRRPERE
jgi:hypothetical protein